MLKKVFYIIIAVLVLQVIKVVLIKLTYRFANFAGILIMAAQFYLVVAPLIYFPINALFRFIKTTSLRKLYSIFLTLLFLVGLEWLMAFYLNHPRSIPGILQEPIWLFYEKYDFRIIQYEKDHGVYDKKVFYRLNPNSSFVFSNREFSDSFHINSKGLRDDESSLSYPSIICLGDSYFMGWGISQDSCFASLLESRSKMKVLNAAISSYGTARELTLLKELNRDSLKYLIIQYCVNDWIENKYYLSHNRQLKISPEKQFNAEQLEHYLSRLYFPGRYSSMIGQLLIKFSINKVYPVFNLPYDRNKLVSDEKEQAKDFLEILFLNRELFGRSKLIITLMDSEKRIDNKFLKEVEKELQNPRYRELSAYTTVVHTEKVFGPEDFYLLDQHARASAYDKLSTLVIYSLNTR